MGVEYELLGSAAMVAHFAFLAYLLVGGFLAWWPRLRATIVAHVAVVGWGIAIITVGQECPLTHVENWARRRAGGQDLSGGFIDTYLTGVVYPADHLTEVRLLVAAVVLASWVGLAVRAWRRSGDRRSQRATRCRADA